MVYSTELIVLLESNFIPRYLCHVGPVPLRKYFTGLSLPTLGTYLAQAYATTGISLPNSLLGSAMSHPDFLCAFFHVAHPLELPSPRSPSRNTWFSHSGTARVENSGTTANSRSNNSARAPAPLSAAPNSFRAYCASRMI